MSLKENNIVFKQLKRALRGAPKHTQHRKQARALTSKIEKYYDENLIILSNVHSKLHYEGIDFYDDEEAYNELHSKLYVLGQDMIRHPFFNKSNYYFKNTIPEEYKNAGSHNHVNFFIDIEKESGVLLWANERSNGERVGVWVIPFIIINDEDSLPILTVDKNAIENDCVLNQINSVIEKQYISEDRVTSVDGLLKSVFSMLVRCLGNIKHNDFYPFMKTGKGAGEVIFLNKDLNRPSTYDSTSATAVDGECKVTPHERRGTWKTLSHEKFKNHPLFRKPNAIYVRPTWVGEEVVNYKGKSYKILLTKEERLEYKSKKLSTKGNKKMATSDQVKNIIKLLGVPTNTHLPQLIKTVCKANGVDSVVAADIAFYLCNINIHKLDNECIDFFNGDMRVLKNHLFSQVSNHLSKSLSNLYHNSNPPITRFKEKQMPFDIVLKYYPLSNNSFAYSVKHNHVKGTITKKRPTVTKTKDSVSLSPTGIFNSLNEMTSSQLLDLQLEVTAILSERIQLTEKRLGKYSGVVDALKQLSNDDI